MTVLRPLLGPHGAYLRRRYARRARTYDETSIRLDRARSAAVERLAPAPGETIVDLGCGTGVNFGRLRSAVGEQGRVVGVEANAGMAAVARERIAREGWSNVELQEGDARDAALAPVIDGVLVSFAHDVLVPEVLDRVVARLRPGGRISVAGGRLGPWREVRSNLRTIPLMWRHVGDPRGYRRPWAHLEERVESLELLTFPGGFHALGVRGDPAAKPSR